MTFIIIQFHSLFFFVYSMKSYLSWSPIWESMDLLFLQQAEIVNTIDVDKNTIEEKHINIIFKTLFETAVESLLVIDDKGTIVLNNARTDEMFGYAKDELLGNRMEILLPDRFAHRHEHLRKDYIKNPSRRSMGIGMDLWGKRKDKSEFPVEVSLNYFHVGGRTFVMALISDITKRFLAESHIKRLNEELEILVQRRTKELEESKKLYQTVARNFPSGSINVFDKNFNYLFAEGTEFWKKGISGEKLLGTNFMSHLPEEVREEVKGKLKQVLKGINSSFEIKLNGSVYHINAVGITDSDKTIDQVLIVARNITDHKKAEENTRRALEKEIHLNELKSRFVSLASHEFRTPLSTILSSTALIERYFNKESMDAGELRENSERHLKRIRSTIGNLTNILNDFLSLEKLEQGKTEVKASRFNIDKFSEEHAGLLRGVLKTGQKIKYSHKGIKKEVFTDSMMLKNILNNLISNASKYSAEETDIELKTRLDKTGLTILVTDYGMGIPEDEQKHLFERFFRARNVHEIEGTGLGLNIVKRYVDLLNGELTVASKENVGTTVTLHFKPEDIKAE